RALLRNLGITVVENDVLPAVGCVFDGTDDNRSGAILYSIRESEYLPFATGYFGAEHRNVIRSVFQDISRPFASSETSGFVPDIVKYDQAKLENELKLREPFYNKDDVTVRFETVPVSSLYLS